MGYKVEHNTMLRLTSVDNIDINDLQVGKEYEIKRDNARLYPVEIPILLLSEDWKVLGYAMVKELELSDSGSEIEFLIISLFSQEVSEQYSKDLQDALRASGYLKD